MICILHNLIQFLQFLDIFNIDKLIDFNMI